MTPAAAAGALSAQPAPIFDAMSLQNDNVPPLTMQTTALCLLLLSACCIGGALGVTVTYYTDNACTNAAPSPSNGVSNPLLLPSGACTLAFQGSQSVSYAKPTACSSTGTATIGSFTEATCTTAGPAGVVPYSVGTCLTAPTPLPPNMLSVKVSCSPAASASVAFFAVVAAVAAACM
jgi:hypothetical protein